MKRVFFLLFFLFLNHVHGTGFQWENDVFKKYVYIELPQFDPQVRVVKPRLLVLEGSEWVQVTSVFQTFLQSDEWWERKASYMALSILLEPSTVQKLIQKPRLQWWTMVARLQEFYGRLVLQGFNDSDIISQVMNYFSLTESSAQIIVAYIQALNSMFLAYLKEDTAEKNSFALEQYQKAALFDFNINGRIGDEEDYQENIKKENETHKISLWLELERTKKEVENKFLQLTDRDWYEWVYWLSDERFLSGTTWRGGWRWIKNNETWEQQYVFSSEKIAGLVFALLEYKKKLEFILSVPDWRNTIPREHFFLLLDAFFGPNERSLSIKKSYLRKGQLNAGEQFSLAMGYYVEGVPHSGDEVELTSFYEKTNPVFQVDSYEGRLVSIQGYVSRTGFSVIEKFKLIQEYFEYIKKIYEKYVSFHPWKELEGFQFEGVRWDKLAVPPSEFQSGLNLCLKYHPQLSFKENKEATIMALSAPTSVHIEKKARIHFDEDALQKYKELKKEQEELGESLKKLQSLITTEVKYIQGYRVEIKNYPSGFNELLQKSSVLAQKIFPYAQGLKEKILEQARFETYEFLIKNKIVAATSLAEFHNDPESVSHYFKIPHEILYEYRETALALPKLPIVLGRDQRFPNSQFLFHEDFLSHLHRVMVEKQKEEYEHYQKTIEVFVEQLLSPYYLKLDGMLYRDDSMPRNPHVEKAIVELKKYDFGFGKKIKWSEVFSILEPYSSLVSQEAGLPNDHFDEKCEEFCKRVIESHPLYQFWLKRKALVRSSIELSRQLVEIDEKREQVRLDVKRMSERTGGLHKKIEGFDQYKVQEIAEKKRRIQYISDAAQREKILKDFIDYLDTEKVGFANEIENIKKTLPERMEALLMLNAQWMGIIISAPYLLANVDEKPLEEFFKNPHFFYQVIAEKNISSEEYENKDVVQVSTDELQNLFDKSLRIAIQNMDECFRHVSQVHTYEDKLSLLLNPFVEERILSQDKEGTLKPLIDSLKEEHKVLAAAAQNKEFWIRYGSIPIVIGGSFFITGGIGTLFFLGTMMALDAGEYYYVYVQDHENLQTQFQNLMVNVPNSDARFGSFSTFDKLRHELYGFENPEGFFETLESFGSINWLKFSLATDGLVLLRPIKLTQYVLRQKYHKLHRLYALMESSPELQRMLAGEEGMSALRKFLETLPHADMPQDLIRAVQKISEELPRAERASIEIRASRSGYEVLSLSQSAEFLKRNGTAGLAILEGVYNKLRQAVGLSEEAFGEFLKKEGLQLEEVCKIKKGKSLKLETPSLDMGPEIQYPSLVWVTSVDETKLQKLLTLAGEEGLRVKPDLVRKILLSEILPRLQKTHPDQIFQEAFSIIREALESSKPIK